MLAISNPVLQACVLLLRSFRRKWRTSVFDLFAEKSRCPYGRGAKTYGGAEEDVPGTHRPETGSGPLRGGL